MTDMTGMTQKTALRRTLAAQRGAISPQQREAYSRMACERLQKSFLWRQASGVLLTVPTLQELDVTPLLKAALKQGKPLFLPACSGEKMTFYELRRFDELRRGAFGLWEPPKERPLRWRPGLLLVAPAIACDKQGVRLGMGGGYYDRFLKNFEGKTVCLVFEELFFDLLPREEHDEPVEVVITQSRTLFVGSSSHLPQEAVWPKGHTAPLGDAL